MLLRPWLFGWLPRHVARQAYSRNYLLAVQYGDTASVISPTRRMFDQVSCRYVRASTRSQRESIPDGEIDKAAPRLAQHAVHWQMRRKPVKEMAIVRNKSFVDRPSRACFSFGPFFFARLRAESRFLGFDARSRGWLCLKIK
ncbi:hypothetical protein M431DRAFT_507297 [Trichoderma harzianum CBS 226.95]|uniref:Uncharacterized protein n=1 Tax=Trichoderma harzianum CBS 226.95 TaxID=983964 RepID=A0A2T4AEV7_TRIHA|nr:hypothetical protein M431DRAFT_507297 [Trichoderma harzianum CBS 226.95]PTB55624.1 hypothetical protein M431DRAFT_507297 [Trichoderma harzianum CBS 226.95]